MSTRATSSSPPMPAREASRWTITQTPKKKTTAGMAAATMTSAYGMPVNSTMRNAAAPITGGSICPPEDAEASTPPANSGR